MGDSQGTISEIRPPPPLLNIHTTEKINLFREETVVLMSRDDGRGHYADRWVANIGGEHDERNAQSRVFSLPSVPVHSQTIISLPSGVDK